MYLKLYLIYRRKSKKKKTKDYCTVVGKVFRSHTSPEAGMSKNYCTTNSGSPKVELRLFPWLCPYYVYTVKKG
jgi:hypothetical protein